MSGESNVHTEQEENDQQQDAKQSENDAEQASLSGDQSSELDLAKQKAEENWDLYVRSQAEMDNLRRRSQKDLENAHKYAVEKLVMELLPVKDSLELGLDAVDADADKLREGTELTLKMFVQTLQKFAVAEVDPVGKPFDPNLHQAMTMQPSNEHAPNTVISVMQKGYTLNDRLLRPAMVVVSQAQPES